MAREPKKTPATPRRTVSVKKTPGATIKKAPATAKKATTGKKTATGNRTAAAKATTPVAATSATAKLGSNLKIKTPITRDQFKNVEPTKPGPDGKTPDPRLAEVVAALRRELEAVALIAAPEDRAVPQFHVAEVDLDLSYAVTELEDDGVRVTIDREALSNLPDRQVHKLKLKIVDAEVLQLSRAPIVEKE